MKVTVWNENQHEKTEPRVTDLYPGGIHAFLAQMLECDDIQCRTATLDDPECGLTEEVLNDTDVLIWWGHMAHARVPDEIVDRVQHHVLAGMGLVVLHSGHKSKIFTRLMGTTGNLKWRENAKERIWTVCPNHPITKGIPETFTLDAEEVYGEPFGIPEPQETIFISWFDGGEVFRSGCTWTRGNGRIFYFQPGHETNPTFHNPYVQQIIKNGIHWVCPVEKNLPLICPRVTALEPIASPCESK